MRGLRTYEDVVVRVGREMCVVEEERRDASLAKLHERLPDTWDRETTTTQPPDAPKLTNCWSPMHSKSLVSINVLV
jgi:hypothetical protein